MEPDFKNIREKLLAEVRRQTPDPKNLTSSPLQAGSVLRVVAEDIGTRHSVTLEQAILTAWHDLFRTGFLAWGLNLSNPDAPFFHITDQGRLLLSDLSRDPGNPQGYLSRLYASCKLGDIGQSYLGEALDCYASGFHKAAAVMTGAVAESVVLELRDALVKRMKALGRPVSPKLNDWKIKTVFDAIRHSLSAVSNQFPHPLRDAFDSYWPAFAHQIRTVRNDAGHPVSVSPVSPETVHSSLLVLPELIGLQNKLKHWIEAELK